MTDYTPRQVSHLHAAGAIQLIDVREPQEWQAGRIAGAKHIRLSDLTRQAQAIDPKRPVVFYCRSGARSAMATDAFNRAGFDAHNMTGGLLDWRAAGLPLEPAGGVVADS